MTVNDVLKLTAQYIGEVDLLKTSTLGGTETATEQQSAKLNMLLACLNDTVQTLALMYFPLKYEEEISSSNGIYEFSDLTKPIIDIIKLTDKYKMDVDFALFPLHFEAKKGTLNIIYTYLPEYVQNFTDELEVTADKVSARIVALGTASRYFMFMGMYSDATSWNNMFEQACLVAKRKKNNVVIKKRGWF